jgi:DHA1 family bicyclomycin/chloramphenicol resistance-like MFS transporter
MPQDGPRPYLVVVATLGLLTAVGPFSLDAYLPALPAIAADLAASTTTVQLSLTACLLGLGFGQLIVGPLGDRFGRRGPILVGVALYTVASLGCALAPSAEALIVWRGAQGLGGAAGLVLARAVVQDIATGHAAVRLYSQLAVISGLAPVIAPVLGAGIFVASGWRGVFVLLAGLGALLVILTLVALRETHAIEHRSSAHPVRVIRTYGRLLADRGFRSFLIVSILTAALLFAYISSSPFVLQTMFGLSEVAFALVFAGNGVGIALAGIVNARVVSRVRPVAILRWAVAAQVVAVAVLAVGVVLKLSADVDTSILVIAALCAAITPLGFILPTSMALAMARSDGRAGSASALLGTSSFLVGALVSPVSGLGQPGVAMVAVMLGAATLCLVTTWRTPPG